jgi:hypothetical protein
MMGKKISKPIVPLFHHSNIPIWLLAGDIYSLTGEACYFILYTIGGYSIWKTGRNKTS